VWLPEALPLADAVVTVFTKPFAANVDRTVYCDDQPCR